MAHHGIAAALLNMSLTGAMGTVYVLLVGSELNGPTIGAIFTVVGFAAFGKHPKNIIWIMLGVYIGSMLKDWSANDPSAVLAARSRAQTGAAADRRDHAVRHARTKLVRAKTDIAVARCA